MNQGVEPTSIGMTIGKHFQVPVLGLMLCGNLTTPGVEPASTSVRLRIEQTSVGNTITDESSAGAIAELRRVSGFTWDQLAKLFGVTRRSLHFWASGKAMTVENQVHLQQLLATIRKIDRGSAATKRAALMGVLRDGTVPFELLVEGKFTRVASMIGEGTGRPAFRPLALSDSARAARKPRPPHELVDALHDRVHVEKGKLLSSTPIRTKRET